jgi:hypothetical protein
VHDDYLIPFHAAVNGGEGRTQTTLTRKLPVLGKHGNFVFKRSSKLFLDVIDFPKR